MRNRRVYLYTPPESLVCFSASTPRKWRRVKGRWWSQLCSSLAPMTSPPTSPPPKGLFLFISIKAQERFQILWQFSFKFIHPLAKGFSLNLLCSFSASIEPDPETYQLVLFSLNEIAVEDEFWVARLFH